jgi:uncharacterized repeat protein (TIGR03803 family)
MACVSFASGFSVLHEFAGDDTDGGLPYYGGLTLQGGVLYGVASYGGPNWSGVAFRINPDGTGYSLLHAFGDPDIGGNGDGVLPYNSDLAYADGKLYGTTFFGPTNIGTIWSVDTSGNNYSIVYDQFGNSFPAGRNLQAGLVISGNNLYGITFDGGSGGGGTVFRVGTDGNNFAVLHPLDYYTEGGLSGGTLELSGNTLYGMTGTGGPNDAGALFKLGTDGSGFTLLHEFGDFAGDGEAPFGSVTCVGEYLYGMTCYGGTHSVGDGDGTLFRIGTDGSGYTILKEFSSNSDGGAWPTGSLMYNAGMLYGMTSYEGPSGYGAIFRLDPENPGSFTVLYNFEDDAYGAGGDLVPYKGHLYGMTVGGPSSGNDAGVIFSLSTPEFDAIEDTYAGLGLDFTSAQMDDLTNLYYEGKNGLSPDPITIGDITWEYFGYTIEGKNPGDAWKEDGVYYFYLGSGVKGTAGGSGDVPEPSTLLLLLPFIGFGLRKLRRK